jgi:hypothetical protein
MSGGARGEGRRGGGGRAVRDHTCQVGARLQCPPRPAMAALLRGPTATNAAPSPPTPPPREKPVTLLPPPAPLPPVDAWAADTAASCLRPVLNRCSIRCISRRSTVVARRLNSLRTHVSAGYASAGGAAPAPPTAGGACIRAAAVRAARYSDSTCFCRPERRGDARGGGGGGGGGGWRVATEAAGRGRKGAGRRGAGGGGCWCERGDGVAEATDRSSLADRTRTAEQLLAFPPPPVRSGT